MVKIEGMAEEQYYLVGKIVNTQALRGEVRVMATIKAYKKDADISVYALKKRITLLQTLSIPD